MTTNTEITEAQGKIQRPTFTALCGRAFRSDPEFFPQAEYRGEIIYLCTDACLDAFHLRPRPLRRRAQKEL